MHINDGCRKLGELGYQRSADKCKEKFEEESRHFNSMSYTKNYRFFSDLDELYHDDNPQVSNEKNQALGKEKDQQEEDKMDLSQQQEETENAVTANPSQENAELVKESMRSRKRKRKYKFEMFKGFCEAVVKRIVAQQEDLHNKLIEDMLKRDAECIAREEAWKCQEMDRINKEIEMRAQEHIIAGDRQAKIIDLLKKFTSGSHADQNLIRKIEDFCKVTKSSSSVTSSSEILPHNPNETASSMSNVSHQNPTLPPTSSSRETTPSPQNNHYSTLVTDSNTPQATSSSALAMASQSPHKNASQSPLKNTHAKHVNPMSSTPSFAPKSSQKTVYKPNDQREEKVAGKRWPRDEVQALINLKCSHTNNSGDDHKEGIKGPLWERISQAMLELGYKRSAKRCKEKWENINKYFRKTKDSNKKRSLESRTCPYFHQLSSLYDQGKLVAHSDALPENSPSSNTATCTGTGTGGETTRLKQINSS